jgi:hypothetical protein
VHDLIRNLHLGLRRVHVHIHAIRRQRDEEVNLGTLPIVATL